MDKTEIVVVAVALLLIVFTLWFFFGQRDEKPQALGEKPIYACPMHAWITSEDPAANCSICGMKLVRRDDESALQR